MPARILQMNHLTELRLVGNDIKELPVSIGTLLHSLQILVLHSNKLETLPDTIGDLKDLKVLNLADNVLAALNPHICRYDSIYKPLYVVTVTKYLYGVL